MGNTFQSSFRTFERRFEDGMEGCVCDVSAIGVCRVGFDGGSERERVMSPVRGESEDGLQVVGSVFVAGLREVGGSVTSAEGTGGAEQRRRGAAGGGAASGAILAGGAAAAAAAYRLS